MQRKLVRMLHLVREPVSVYFANTAAVCDMDANPETRNWVFTFLGRPLPMWSLSSSKIIFLRESSSATMPFFVKKAPPTLTIGWFKRNSQQKITSFRVFFSNHAGVVCSFSSIVITSFCSICCRLWAAAPQFVAGFKGCSLAPVLPRRYCRLVRQMRHLAPAEISSSLSADSLFKVQSAFLQKKKADTYG